MTTHRSAGTSFRRLLANAPVTASVVRRHLVRRPTRTDGPAYDGHLSDAIATASSPALRAYLEGELAVLTPPALPGLDTGLVPRPYSTNRRLPGGRVASASERIETNTACTVLHLVTNSLPETVAGYTIRTHGIAAAQAAHGLEVHVVTRLGFPVTKAVLDAAEGHEIDGVRYHRLLAPVSLRADVARARDLAQTAALVQRLRPDVLHAHSNHLNAQVALAVGRRFGIPVVYEVRGFLEETWVSRRSLVEPVSTGSTTDVSRPRESESYRLARAAEAWAMRHADAVVTISESMREAILRRGIDPATVSVAPNAVPDAWLEESGWSSPPGRSSSAEERGAYRDHGGSLDGLDTSPVELVETYSTGRRYTIGTVGTLNAYEGLDLLLEATARVTSAGTPVRVLIVGDGPARADLERQAHALGVDATFTGRVGPDQMADFHRRLDVFCVPRRDLPVTRVVPPLKPLEAMALGRPVIASDLPPLREIVRDQHTGLLVAPDDVEALATAIGTLARRADARHQLGANAREFVRTDRTWTAVHHILTGVYASLDQGVLHA